MPNQSDKRKILVIGRGFLGESIYRVGIGIGYEVVGTHHSRCTDGPLLDISDINQVEFVIKKINPDHIINSAALGNVDFLETHQDLAMQVNYIGASNVAKISNENDIGIIHISTDSVFDGLKGGYSEDDKPNPINAYSRSKHLGELEVSKNSKNHIVIRTNFYGINKRGDYFFNWILNNLKSNNTITGFTDIIFSPLDVTTLGRMIIELLDVKYRGILHLSSGKPISKFDFIIDVARKLKMSSDNIKRGSQSNNPTLAPRPKNTWLKNDVAKKLLKTPILDLSSWIDRNRSEINRYLK